MIMLDLPKHRGVENMGPGEVVGGDELDAIANAQGFTLNSGDILLIRTGWHKVFYSDNALWNSAVPGPDGSLASWLKDRNICAIGADQPTVEARKSLSEPEPSYLHRYALRDLGIYLLENLNLEDLAKDQIYEFLFVGAPLPLTEASGTPWNPLALV